MMVKDIYKHVWMFYAQNGQPREVCIKFTIWDIELV